MPVSPAVKFYDPLTERWITMPAAPVIERPKPKTEAEKLNDRITQNIRIAQHSKLWDAIEATATATQMSQPCRDGSESGASAS